MKYSVIAVTERAIKKVKKLKAEEGNDTLMLRLYITGGGCSGFSYGFSFEEEKREDDTIIENDSVVLLVDALSIQYLMGSQVDYLENLQGSRFVVNNPNAVTTCGCGSSFSI